MRSLVEAKPVLESWRRNFNAIRPPESIGRKPHASTGITHSRSNGPRRGAIDQRSVSAEKPARQSAIFQGFLRLL
jgi:hypothetical protein